MDTEAINNMDKVLKSWNLTFNDFLHAGHVEASSSASDVSVGHWEETCEWKYQRVRIDTTINNTRI